MPKYDYDVITIGGGLGGAGLATVLAEKGLRVLVTEREVEFKDRIRGESMAPRVSLKPKSWGSIIVCSKPARTSSRSCIPSVSRLATFEPPRPLVSLH